MVKYLTLQYFIKGNQKRRQAVLHNTYLNSYEIYLERPYTSALNYFNTVSPRKIELEGRILPKTFLPLGRV